MKKLFLKTLMTTLVLLTGGVSSAWAAGYTRTLTADLSVSGYKAKQLYDFQNNNPEVLPTSGDLRYREYGNGGYWGLHNFASGGRSGTATIPVANGDILVLQIYSSSSVPTINRGSQNTSMTSLNSPYYVYDITADADDITFTVPRNGGIVAALVMEKDASAATADYTINYVLGTETVKTSTGNAVVGSSVTTDASFFVDDVKYFRADGQSESFEIGESGNDFSVSVRLAETYSYMLSSSLGTTISTGSGLEGETVNVGYSRYQLQETKFYEAAVTNKEYRKSLALTSDNVSQTVDYSEKTETGEVVFCQEAEALDGFTTVTSGNIPARASNALAAVSSEDVVITSLPAGKYIIHAGAFTSKSTSQTIYIGYGETQIGFSSSSNLNETASDEIVLTESTDIKYFGTTSSGDAQFDYIWIEKTGNITIPVTFKYVDENRTDLSEYHPDVVVYGEPGTYIPNLITEDMKADFYVDEEQTIKYAMNRSKYLVMEGDDNRNVPTSGAVTVELEFIQHIKSDYKIMAQVDGEDLTVLASGKSFLNDDVRAMWSKYIQVDNQWYVADKEIFKVYINSSTKNNVYSYSPTNDVDYFFEAEDLECSHNSGTRTDYDFESSIGSIGLRAGATFTTKSKVAAGNYTLTARSIKKSAGEQTYLISYSADGETWTNTGKSLSYTTDQSKDVSVSDVEIPEEAYIRLTEKNETDTYGAHDWLDYIVLDDPAVPFNPNTLIVNGDFEGTYESAYTINTDRYVYKPEGWTVDYKNVSTWNMTVVGSTDAMASNFTDSYAVAEGNNKYMVRFRDNQTSEYVDLSQTVTVPYSGAYTFSADMIRENGSKINVSLYAGENSVSNANPNVWENRSVTVELEANTEIKVGVRFTNLGADGVKAGIDNIQVSFKSFEEIAAEELAAAKDELQKEIEKSVALKTAGRTEGLDEYDTAIADAESVYNNGTTVEDVNAAIAPLQAAQTTFLVANKPIADGTYYVYNPLTEKFLARGNAYGTAAVVADYGVAITVSSSDANYSLVGFDNNASYGFDEWMYADAGGNDVRTYILDKVENGITMTNTSNSKLVYVYLKEDANKYRVAGNAIKDDNYSDDAQTVWQFITPKEYNDMIANRIAAEKTAAFAAAEIAEDAEVVPGEPVELTFASGNGWTQTVVREQKDQPATNGNGTEMWQATGYYTQTVSDLPSGLYKVSIQAFYRSGDATECATRYETGNNTVLAYLDANGSLAQVKSWAEDKGEGNDPNSMEQAKAKFEAGKYLSETYTYVGEDGKLNLTVYNPAFVGNGWFIVGNVKYAAVTLPIVPEKPTFTPASGTYYEAQNVTLACETAGAAIYYTLDGTEPTSESTLYSEAIPVVTTTTIKAVAILGSKQSEVAEATYTIAAALATEADYTALAEAIGEIEGKLGFLNGEYAPYNNIDALQKLADAKAIDTSVDNLQEDVQKATSDLTGAGWVANETEVNAIFDGSFEHDYSGQTGYVNPLGWQRVKDAAADGYNVRLMKGSNAGLAATTSGKALFTKQSAYYGYAEGYTMPLKENTIYKISFVYGGWGDCKKDGYVSITAPDGSAVEFTPTDLPLDATNADSNKDSWKSYTAFFKTGEAGEYVLGLRKKNYDTSGQSQYVFGDIAIFRATAADFKDQLAAEITKAGKVDVTTNVGEAAFQIPASAVTGLTSVITTSQGVYEDADATIDDVLQAVENLKKAEEDYSNAELNAPEEGKLFNVVNVTKDFKYKNNALTFMSSINADLTANTTSMGWLETPGSIHPQAIKFTPVEGVKNGYTMSYTRADGNVVYVSTGKTSGLGTNTQQIRPTTDATKALTFVVNSTGDNTWTLFNTEDGHNVGSSGDTGFYTAGGSNKDVTIQEAVNNEVTLTIPAENQYATLIVPFDADIPEGVLVYSVNEADGNELQLEPKLEMIKANTPYIVYAENGVTTTLSGLGAAFTEISYTAGWLTGVYAETEVPNGSYVLQNHSGVVAFYVVKDVVPKVQANHAYMTMPASVEGARAFYLNGETTAISALKALTSGDAEIYDVNGRKQVKLQKGVNIIKTKDGRTQKVMVK